MQKTDYYPFGLAHAVSNTHKNKYLYNGKELQDELIGGTLLGLFDYGARFYDPRIGRWGNPDPLAERHFNVSPFAYCANEPINRFDPDGRDWYQNKDASATIWARSSEKIYEKNGITYKNIGSTYSSQMGDGNYINFYQNIGYNSSESFNAMKYILDTPSEYYSLINKDSELWGKGKEDLFIANMHKGQQAFAEHPVTEFVLETATKVFGIKASIKVLSFATGLSIKPLRAEGGRINGFTISKGEGYGAKSRFDMHPLSRASKKNNTLTIPKWLQDLPMPHYHSGKGNTLRIHKPWELNSKGKRVW